MIILLIVSRGTFFTAALLTFPSVLGVFKKPVVSFLMTVPFVQVCAIFFFFV